ncbi:hypothetical protein MUK42_31867 [Musa troglodytarum]|uniref:Uncharacterized protein n=1 Tax=Musa troglodytarum TaxID=320322 RepID=A0A9E7JVH1_9LILI|nr:hypothetical protein MUK42_31867 [Musa troglodytarum]
MSDARETYACLYSRFSASHMAWLLERASGGWRSRQHFGPKCFFKTSTPAAPPGVAFPRHWAQLLQPIWLASESV